MALVLKDRVKETTATTGTGAISLGGAVANFQAFSAVLSNADTTYYAIVDTTNTAFEVGLGTYASSGNTLTRTTVLESSNSGSAVDFGAGSKSIFIAYPGEKSAYLDASNQLVINGTAVTSTPAELNILDGVTSTTAELNILDGVTSTATELNFLDGSTADTVVNSKAVIYGAAGQIIASELDVDNIQVDSNAVKSTDTNGNIQLFPNGTGFTELYGNTNPGTVRFNCESNSHGVTVKGPAHSAAATYTVNLPDTLGTSAASTLITANASAKVTLTGTTSVAEIIEKVDIPTSTTGTINFDALSQAVQLYNTDQTANRTINFRGDGSTALNAVMAVGESMTSAVLMKQGGSAYYLNAYQVDGSSITPEWSGGSAPSAGNANSIDAYTFTIIKTADATFTVLASQSQYA